MLCHHNIVIKCIDYIYIYIYIYTYYDVSVLLGNTPAHPPFTFHCCFALHWSLKEIAQHSCLIILYRICTNNIRYYFYFLFPFLVYTKLISITSAVYSKFIGVLGCWIVSRCFCAVLVAFLSDPPRV
jgi:hypothetical protein